MPPRRGDELQAAMGGAAATYTQLKVQTTDSTVITVITVKE